MVHAREQARDPFDVLDEMIDWERLVASREEIDTLGDPATQDPLSLAASRYVHLRRFAPAFLEAFEFDAPVAGRSLQAAVELLREFNRSGRRKLPDIVPMRFASRQWKALVADNAKTARRTYETAVVATLRDRLRAGDVWVEGSRDYHRFDAYLPPAHDAERVLAESGIETGAGVWLARRREWLHERLSEVGAKLARGRLEGVRLERAEELVRVGVDAEIDDLEPGSLQHHADEVLADVVDVALHGADDDPSDRRRPGFGKERAQDRHSALRPPDAVGWRLRPACRVRSRAGRAVIACMESWQDRSHSEVS